MLQDSAFLRNSGLLRTGCLSDMYQYRFIGKHDNPFGLCRYVLFYMPYIWRQIFLYIRDTLVLCKISSGIHTL
jgi:hypothetical protein